MASSIEITLPLTWMAGTDGWELSIVRTVPFDTKTALSLADTPVIIVKNRRKTDKANFLISTSFGVNFCMNNLIKILDSAGATDTETTFGKGIAFHITSN